MSTLFDLPKYLLITVLEWLSLSSLRQLDSSLCNRKLRKALVDLISSDCVVFKADSEFSLPDYIIHWLVLRRISVKSVSFNDSSEHVVQLLDNNEFCFRLRSLKVFPELYKLCAFPKYVDNFVNLEFLQIHCEDGFLDDELLLKIGKTSRNLRGVDFAICRKITSVGLCHLLDHCLRIQSIGMKDCFRIDDMGIKALGNYQGAVNLTFLNITKHSGITSEGLHYMCERCINLTHLQLNNCFDADQLCFESIILCTQLVDLRIDNFRALSDDNIDTLVTRCKKINTIDITWCRELTARAVDLIADHYHNLLHFHDRTARYNNEYRTAVVRMVSLCPLLQTLDINSWNYLSPEEFLKIAEYGQSLISFQCHDVYMTNEAIQSFKDAAPKLRELHISWEYLVYCEKTGIWKNKY